MIFAPRNQASASAGTQDFAATLNKERTGFRDDAADGAGRESGGPDFTSMTPLVMFGWMNEHIRNGWKTL